MPNWCENFVQITGDTKKLVEFHDFIVESEDYLYQTILNFITPVEDRVAHKLIDGDENWYSFNMDHFGVKWDTDGASVDLFEDIVEDGVSHLQMSFESPWGPPTNIFETLGNAFPEIRVKLFYIEEGMDFCGILDSFSEEDYHTDEYSSAEDIPEELEFTFDIQERIAEYEADCA